MLARASGADAHLLGIRHPRPPLVHACAVLDGHRFSCHIPQDLGSYPFVLRLADGDTALYPLHFSIAVPLDCDGNSHWTVMHVDSCTWLSHTRCLSSAVSLLTNRQC